MYENELYHHGVKGMKWGVRRKALRKSNENYTDVQRKQDESFYGKRAVKRINKRMNKGYGVKAARHEEIKRRERIETGATAATIALTLLGSTSMAYLKSKNG